ncbi:MAG: hypothetical protein ABFQ62_03810 [Patescibacteria group bacterium]
MKVALTPVLGLPEYSGWSQVFHSPQKRVVCVVTVVGSDAANVGLELLETLQNSSLETAAEFHQVLELLLKRAEEKDSNLQLSCSFREREKEAVIFATYHSLVLLKRDQKVGVLLQSQDKLTLIEGSISLGDRVVLLSNGASAFAQEIEQKLKFGYDTDSIVTSLIPQIHRLENSSLCGIAFLQIDQREEVKEEKFDPKPKLKISDDESEEDDSFDKLFNLETKDLEIDGNLDKSEKNKINFLAKLPKFKSQKLLSVFGLLVRLIKRLIYFVLDSLKKLVSKDGAYLGQEERKKKIIRVALLVLLVVVPISGFFVINWQNKKTQSRDLDEYMLPLLERVESAKQVVQDDPIQARSDIEISLEEIEVLKKKFESKKYAQKIILEEEGKIKVFFEEISGKEEFSELVTFFDLRLIDAGSDFISNSVDLFGDTAVFLDKDKNDLLTLNLESKEGKKIDLAEELKPRVISFDGEDIFILGSGIFSYDLNSDESRNLRDEGDSNREAKFINYFADFVYVFNVSKRNIYRYSPGENANYSDPIGWLKDKQGLDFETVNGMQIDGDVWLSTNVGEIKRYVRGNIGEFEIRGLKEAFSSSIYLFTKEGLENLYVLEPEKNRLVVITKDGDFVKEIKSSTLASATMIIVSEARAKAYAVSGSLLYEIEL